MHRFLLTYLVQSHSKGKICKQEIWFSNNIQGAAYGFVVLKQKWAGFEPVSILPLP